MSIVYVTQETDYDFSRAEAYGEVVFLTRDDLNNLKGSLQNEVVISQLAAKLSKFNEQDDWMVITGSPYIAAAVFLILGKRNVRTVRVLRWDNRDHRYIPLYLELPKGV